MKRALIVALVLAAGCGKSDGGDPEQQGESPPIPVVCVPSRAGSLGTRVSLRGVVGVPPDKEAVVAPLASGRIVDLKVREGQRVRAGDPIAVIDDPDLGAAVSEAGAALPAAQANLVSAEAALARARRLFQAGIAPRREVDDAEARWASAAAETEAARARRNLAARKRDRARVTAPIAGVVVRVLRRAGELVDGTPATPIVHIADTTNLELLADAPAADLVRVREGAAVAILLDALPGEKLGGTIVFVAPAIDPATSLGLVRAAIVPPASGLQLKLGLAGRIGVDVAGRSGAVLVPAVALRRSDEGASEVVVCVREGDATTAQVRPVEVGARRDAEVEITSGLTAGERVVTTHVLGLEDGAALEASAPAAGKAPP